MINMVVSDSDSESYTESSDNEDQYDSESAYGGHAQSILSSLDESIEKIDDFLAFGRRFTHGDIVHSVTSPSGQMGRVVGVDTIVDLETSTGELIKDINSKNLLRLLSFASGDYVICGPWLGRVRKVFDLVTILFSDGAKCEIMTGDPDILMPIPPNLNDEEPYPYYPGQHVKTKLPAFSKSVRWLCGSWKVSQDEGTVCHVEVGLVDVNWIASITICQGSSAPIPPHLQDPKKLTLLSCFPCSNWQIGDWCTLPNDYFSEVLMSCKESCALGFTTQHFVQVQKELGRKNEVCKEIFVIAKVKTKVDVVWQNRLVSIGIHSNTLSPVAHVSDHDFWPEQFVLEKVISEDVVVPGGQRLGIVKKVNAQEQTVEVKWICPAIEKTVASIGASNEEIVSAYELIEHPDFSYSVGDIVFRLLPDLARFEENLHHAQTDGEYQDLPVKGVSCEVLLEQVALEKHTHEGQDEYAAGYLSHIGNVIGFKDEGFEVKWASGLISKVHPSEIIGLDRLDDPPSATVVGEVANLETAGNGIPRQETQYWQENKEAVNDSDDYKTFMWSTCALTVPKTAIGFLTNVAASLFGLFGSTSQSGSTKPAYLHCLKNLGLLMPPLDPTTEICSVRSEGTCKLQYLKTEVSESEVDDVLPEDLKQKGEAAKHHEQATFSPGKEKSVQFKQFDIVDDHSDHQLVNCVGKGMAVSLVRRGWLNKVQQEWNILKNNLPDDIYVRVYEERIDLLRASIIGAPGTPYHNGLFFFDILLPPDYPLEPPMVHYNSCGLRLNPNLYESGKVCLSLLKTWTGTGTEVWNPENSTILQVLLSLQALVLNDKPYFNEAGYDKQLGRAEGERNSMNYNENAFLVTCRMMLYHLRKPPKHFEALVEEHFAQRAHSILLTCKAYMDGVQVGSAFKGGSEGQRSSSTGFKIMVEKLYPKLISGFTEKGIDCSQFIGQVDLPDIGKDLVLN